MSLIIGGHPFEINLKKIVEDNKEKIVYNDFIYYLYRDKYNLCFNDERILSTSLLYMELDLTLVNEHKKVLQNITNKIKEKKLAENDLRRLYMSEDEDFSDEEINKFWDDEDFWEKVKNGEK